MLQAVACIAECLCGVQGGAGGSPAGRQAAALRWMRPRVLDAGVSAPSSPPGLPHARKHDLSLPSSRGPHSCSCTF